MAFTETLKLEVKKKANFRCCRCYEIGVDIHHIIPQAQNGSDDIDNAAQVAAVGSLGISTGDVVRWLILLAALGVLGYYLLRRSQTGSAL